MPKYLQKRRRRWYAVMEIPQDLKAYFGKPRFMLSLQTESLSEAERRVHSVVAKWKGYIHAKRSGQTHNGPIDFTQKLSVVELHLDQLRRAGVKDPEIKLVQEDIAIDAEDENLWEAVQVAHGSLIRLDHHIEDFLAESDAQPKSKDMQRTDLQKFAKAFPYADDATKKKVIEWVNSELIGNQGLSLSTCRRHISACRVYWRWLERHKDLELLAPFDGVVPSQRKKKTKQDVRDRRKGFHPKDYQALLSSASERGDADLADLIRLGAYTGCRIEELCGLKLTNVLSDRIKIEDAKTEAGWREVPIHRHIQQLVARLKDTSKDGYLLSGLTFNKYGDRSNAIGKRFGRLKKVCGYGPDYVFHSFRKGVATQLESANVPENHVARLLGHELKTMSYGLYSGGVSFGVLEAAIGHLDWTLGHGYGFAA